MLSHLRASGFKSLESLDLRLPGLTLVFGPNGVGKSNIADALTVLGRLARERTVTEALTNESRGYIFEQVRFPEGGLPALLKSKEVAFTLGGVIKTPGHPRALEYEVSLGISPGNGSAVVMDELLREVRKDLEPMTTTPAIMRYGDKLRIPRKGAGAHPREEPIRSAHTQLSDLRWQGAEYPAIHAVRAELSGLRTYYLDPRVAMRAGVPPQAVEDIGPLGEKLSPFLYRLQEQYPASFRAAIRAFKLLIPSVTEVQVRLDETRGLLDLEVIQDGTAFSARLLSEGTLRILALCAIAASPFESGLIAFEEPENGVHPRRIERVAALLGHLAMGRKRQVLVTSHSPLFCMQIIQLQRQNPDDVAIYVASRAAGSTSLRPLDVSTSESLFDEYEIEQALESEEEKSLQQFTRLLMRGLLDV